MRDVPFFSCLYTYQTIFWWRIIAFYISTRHVRTKWRSYVYPVGFENRRDFNIRSSAFLFLKSFDFFMFFFSIYEFIQIFGMGIQTTVGVCFPHLSFRQQILKFIIKTRVNVECIFFFILFDISLENSCIFFNCE